MVFQEKTKNLLVPKRDEKVYSRGTTLIDQVYPRPTLTFVSRMKRHPLQAV